MKKLILSIAAMLAMATSAYAQIGTIDKDLVYTPVVPCRVFDTRLSQGGTGPIAAGGIGSYYVGGLSSYSGVGGSPTDCGLAGLGNNIAAVAVNFTVVGPAAAGYITAYPYLGTRPTASTVNYTAGQTVANGAIVKASQNGFTAVSIYTYAATDVIADVVGYYSRPVSVGSLECTFVSNTSAAVTGLQSITSTCTAGYIVIGGSCDTSNSAAKPNTGSYFSGNAWTCETNNYPGNTTAASITSTARCCHIPGR